MGRGIAHDLVQMPIIDFHGMPQGPVMIDFRRTP